MDDCHVNSYYALVWSSEVSSKRKKEIKGEKITRQTSLPEDPRILYAANKNDVAKIKTVKIWEEIEYDPVTTKQSVRFWKETEEYILPRDVCIVVWEGSDTLCLSEDNYRIVTPEDFKCIVESSPNVWTEETNEVQGVEWMKHLQGLQKKVLNILNKPHNNKQEIYKSKNINGKIVIQLMVN